MSPLDANNISRPVQEKGGALPEIIVMPAQAGLAIRELYEEFNGNAFHLPQDENSLSQESLKKTALVNPIIHNGGNIFLFHVEPSKDKAELKYVLRKQAISNIDDKEGEELVVVARKGETEKESALYLIKSDGNFLRLKETGFEEENDLENAKTILDELQTIQEKQSAARVSSSSL